MILVSFEKGHPLTSEHMFLQQTFGQRGERENIGPQQKYKIFFV